MPFDLDSALAAAPAAHSDASAVVEKVTPGWIEPLRGPADTVGVEVAGPARLAAIGPAWDDLLARAAEPNIFMDPAVVVAASAARSDANVHALLAWKPDGGELRLIGVWAFCAGWPQKSPLPVRVLNAPASPHSYLATPVIDRDCLDDTLDAMLERLAQTRELPKIVALEAMRMDGPTMAALTRVLAARGSAASIVERFQRPRLASNGDAEDYLKRSLSGSTRKKLRQHRRRLGEMGALANVVVSEPEEVMRALESFLTLEAAGWKGRQGTAILCQRADAAFMRAAVLALAQHGRASIHALYLDRRPVSMQIVARCAAMAFTWKTTYDEHFQHVSPGMLLLEDYTSAFLADSSIAMVDSCAHDDMGFMSAWSERETIADLWFDARRGGSFAFRLWGGLQRNYRELRGFAKAAYHSRQGAK